MYNKFKDIEKYEKSLSKKEVTMKNIVTNIGIGCGFRLI